MIWWYTGIFLKTKSPCRQNYPREWLKFYAHQNVIYFETAANNCNEYVLIKQVQFLNSYNNLKYVQ